MLSMKFEGLTAADQPLARSRRSDVVGTYLTPRTTPRCKETLWGRAPSNHELQSRAISAIRLRSPIGRPVTKNLFASGLMNTSSPFQVAPLVAGRNTAIKPEPAQDPGVLGSGPLTPRHSPTFTRPSTSRKLSRDSAFGPSPESAEGSHEDRGDGRNGVKRACNECRQQKVSQTLSISLERLESSSSTGTSNSN